MSQVKEISQEQFDAEVVNETGPVLVDFWAPWCGPCKALAPVLDEVAAMYDGRLKVVKVNVDENSELAARFGIMGIPTLIVFKNGEPVESITGVQPRQALVERLDKLI